MSRRQSAGNLFRVELKIDPAQNLNAIERGFLHRWKSIIAGYIPAGTQATIQWVIPTRARLQTVIVHAAPAHTYWGSIQLNGTDLLVDPKLRLECLLLGPAAKERLPLYAAVGPNDAVTMILERRIPC